MSHLDPILTNDMHIIEFHRIDYKNSTHSNLTSLRSLSSHKSPHGDVKLIKFEK